MIRWSPDSKKLAVYRVVNATWAHALPLNDGAAREALLTAYALPANNRALSVRSHRDVASKQNIVAKYAATEPGGHRGSA